MNSHIPECIWPLGATLAEGPFWHAQQRALYFVDIKGHTVHRCAEDGSARTTWTLPDQVGFALPMIDGGLLCGLPGKVVRFDPASGELQTLFTLEADMPGNRNNDGYIDTAGRLWFGTMDNGEKAATGALYLWDGKRLQQKDDAYIITNGPCVSPDGRTFYHTDTLAKQIYAFDLAPDGTLSNRRVLIRTAAPGHPDGTAIDAEGTLWVSMFRGARIDRYAPDGTLIGSIPMPCSNITKITFGGADLRTVFVTTARKGLTIDELSREPLAGGIFRFRADAPGLPQNHFLAEH
ncbi:SMP-30/gluconolactonase/LRE family protein [Duganella sp. FT92W]|uniref:SMP-30/gluconolactonase/LRE family protein n=1 Tax=Pseudoduganella rivuli TaxID=2666085 RepID=A0A7X2IMF7_9BURK|nr:SMP-30/gluconolactonase/LRE family protein [Pseudoduganella rivuli]MRV72702.1 SMP-30/gluconolactonase/LRE family protein [Pseudoduganella rivuli]